MVGIDYITCRFKISGITEGGREDWQNITVPQHGLGRVRASVKVPINGACVASLRKEGLTSVLTGGHSDHALSGWEKADALTRTFDFNQSWALMQINPSRIDDPIGTSVASLDEVSSGLEYIQDPPYLGDWIEIEEHLNYWDLYRLDLTVDVETPGLTQQVLAICEPALLTPKQKVVTYRNYQGDLETVEMKPTTLPRLKVYDKRKESKTGPERVRFEMELPRKTLNKRFPTFGDLTEDGIRECFHEHFAQVIAALSNTENSIYDLQLSSADQKTRRELIGYEYLMKQGHYDSLSPTIQKRFLKFLKDHSINSGKDLL